MNNVLENLLENLQAAGKAHVEARRSDLNGVDYTKPLPDERKRGPLPTIANVREILRRLGVIARYNVISKEKELIIPHLQFTTDNAANASYAFILSECAKFGVPTAQLGDYLTFIADSNPYSPVATWISSAPWDGVSRLQALYDTITTHDGEATAQKELLMRRWLVSAVAAAFSPNGVAAAGVLLLQGAQGQGKTRWLRALAPESLNAIADGLLLNPSDRDSLMACLSFWIVELGEIDSTFRKADISALKAFLTRDKDKLRRPYAREESHYPRRTVFFGSVNDEGFLHDTTGNRRFWTVQTKRVNYQHDIDMQQVWAEVHALWKAGEPYWLSDEEQAQLEASNRKHMVEDATSEKVRTRFNWDAGKEFWEWKTVTEALGKLEIHNPTQAQMNRASATIKELNGNQYRKSNGLRLVLVPPINY